MAISQNKKKATVFQDDLDMLFDGIADDAYADSALTDEHQPGFMQDKRGKGAKVDPKNNQPDIDLDVLFDEVDAKKPESSKVLSIAPAAKKTDVDSLLDEFESDINVTVNQQPVQKNSAMSDINGLAHVNDTFVDLSATSDLNKKVSDAFDSDTVSKTDELDELGAMSKLNDKLDAVAKATKQQSNLSKPKSMLDLEESFDAGYIFASDDFDGFDPFKAEPDTHASFKKTSISEALDSQSGFANPLDELLALDSHAELEGLNSVENQPITLPLKPGLVAVDKLKDTTLDTAEVAIENPVPLTETSAEAEPVAKPDAGLLPDNLPEQKDELTQESESIVDVNSEEAAETFEFLSDDDMQADFPPNLDAHAESALDLALNQVSITDQDSLSADQNKPEVLTSLPNKPDQLGQDDTSDVSDFNAMFEREATVFIDDSEPDLPLGSTPIVDEGNKVNPAVMTQINELWDAHNEVKAQLAASLQLQSEAEELDKMARLEQVSKERKERREILALIDNSGKKVSPLVYVGLGVSVLSLLIGGGLLAYGIGTLSDFNAFKGRFTGVEKEVTFLKSGTVPVQVPTNSAPVAVLVNTPAPNANQSASSASAEPWVVNLVSFKQDWYAKRKAEEFTKLGITATVIPVAVEKETWYLLRSKGFSTQEEAVKFAATAKKTLNLASVLVTEDK